MPQQAQAQAQRLAELALKLEELSAQQLALQSQLDAFLAQQPQLAALTQQLNKGQQELEPLELELFQEWKSRGAGAENAGDSAASIGAAADR